MESVRLLCNRVILIHSTPLNAAATILHSLNQQIFFLPASQASSEFTLHCNNHRDANCFVHPPYSANGVNADMENHGTINIHAAHAPATPYRVRANKFDTRTLDSSTSEQKEYFRAGRNSQDCP